MPEAKCNVVVEPGVYADMSPMSEQPACPPPAQQRAETLQ